MTKRKDPADFAQDSRSPFAMTGRICARRPGAAVRNGGSMKTELDSAWESAIHNAERARKAEAEVERLRAELAACREDAERYRWLREHWDDVNHPVDFIICNSFVTTLDADVDAARKGEGE